MLKLIKKSLNSIAVFKKKHAGDEEGVAKEIMQPDDRSLNLGLGSAETKDYWTSHNVTNHFQFSNAAESLDYFDWRNDQYYGYIDLMPVMGQTGKSVLDYGCGPGHDLVGFGHYSKPISLIGVDLSETSLKEAEFRLGLHNIKAELIKLNPENLTLPFKDESFDYIHSSGVLHHTPNPKHILTEFHRVLKPGGTARVMVYNYDSIWVHLYVAYQRNLIQGLYSDKNIRDQFKHSTDGDDCPISNVYRSSEWVSICNSAGFKAEFTGAAVSMTEMEQLKYIYDAIQDRRLPSESRKFLINLKFDKYGLPVAGDHYAGIDGCYLLSK